MTYVDESDLHTIDVWETREGLDAYIERRFDPDLRKLNFPEARPQIIDLATFAAMEGVEHHLLTAAASPS